MLWQLLVQSELLQKVSSVLSIRSRARWPTWWGCKNCRCSFDGSTLVLTEDGYEPIRDLIAYEDRVWSRNEDTGEADWKTVEGRFSNNYDETVFITIRDIETGAEQVLTSNRIHPFFVQLPQSRSLLHLTSTNTDVPPSSEGHHYDGEIENGYWVDAANLKPGYRLLNADETFAEVTQVRIANAPLKAYNISVEDFQTFFVTAEPGDEPVWVHNNCEKKRGKNRIPDTGLQTPLLPTLLAPLKSSMTQMVMSPKNGTRATVLMLRVRNATFPSGKPHFGASGEGALAR